MKGRAWYRLHDSPIHVPVNTRVHRGFVCWNKCSSILPSFAVEEGALNGSHLSLPFFLCISSFASHPCAREDTFWWITASDRPDGDLGLSVLHVRLSAQPSLAALSVTTATLWLCTTYSPLIFIMCWSACAEPCWKDGTFSSLAWFALLVLKAFLWQTR